MNTHPHRRRFYPPFAERLRRDPVRPGRHRRTSLVEAMRSIHRALAGEVQ